MFLSGIKSLVSEVFPGFAFALHRAWIISLINTLRYTVSLLNLKVLPDNEDRRTEVAPVQHASTDTNYAHNDMDAVAVISKCGAPLHKRHFYLSVALTQQFTAVNASTVTACCVFPHLKAIKPQHLYLNEQHWHLQCEVVFFSIHPKQQSRSCCERAGVTTAVVR